MFINIYAGESPIRKTCNFDKPLNHILKVMDGCMHIFCLVKHQNTKLGCWNCNRVRFLPIRCMKREAEWASISFVCIIKPRSPLSELETSRAFFVKQRPTSVNFSYRFQNFVSRLSCVQNPYAQLHHFGGGKRCGVDVPLYAANCGKLKCNKKFVLAFP